MTRDRYPECPERTRAIWAAMTEAGLVGGAGGVLLGRGRLLAREECSLVHGDQFWDTWLTSEDMEPRRGGMQYLELVTRVQEVFIITEQRRPLLGPSLG